MSQGFHALKEKIQYLFDKMDAGERMLSVELDLLKAYTDALSKEIDKNAASILDQFPQEKKNSVSTEKSEDIIEEDKIQLNETQDESSQVLDQTESNDADQTAESKEDAESEITIKEEEQEQSYAKEIPKDESTIEEADIEHADEPKIEEDYFEVTITEDEAAPDEENKIDDSQVDIEEKTPDEPKHDDEVKETEKEKAQDNAQNTTRQKAANEGEIDEEDYGIGWKFKQAKPLGELIDLSEKYVFIQGLFNQDPDRFSKALRKMDESSGVSEALEILEEYTLPKNGEKLNGELLQKLKAYLRIRFSQ